MAKRPHVKFMGTSRWSDSPLVRRPIGPKTHWPDDPLVRKPIGPKTNWSEKVSLVRKSLVRKSVSLTLVRRLIGPKTSHWSEKVSLVRKSVIGLKKCHWDVFGPMSRRTNDTLFRTDDFRTNDHFSNQCQWVFGPMDRRTNGFSDQWQWVVGPMPMPALPMAMSLAMRALALAIAMALVRRWAVGPSILKMSLTFTLSWTW